MVPAPNPVVIVLAGVAVAAVVMFPLGFLFGYMVFG